MLAQRSESSIDSRALATGKPVVATRVGSIPETVLNSETGYVVEPGSEPEMSRRIVELLLDPGKARRMGSAGRRHVVQHWSIERMVTGYEDLIERLYHQKIRDREVVGEESPVAS